MVRSSLGYHPGDQPIPGQDYELLTLLGVGQFGEVWKAEAPGGFEVALKLLDLTRQEGEREFAALRQLRQIRNPHLTPITASWILDEDGNLLNESSTTEAAPAGDSAVFRPGEYGDRSLSKRRQPARLIVGMGLGDKCLSKRLKECKAEGHSGIPLEELLEYMAGAAKGLDYLHRPIHEMGQGRAPIIHRDIKPHNILIVGGEAQVCDFGLARAMPNLVASRTKTAVGTLAYMAPEVAEYRHATARSDQYSFAITYFELRTGKLPFGTADEPNVIDVVRAHESGRLKKLNLLTPAERRVVAKAADKNPARRYVTCSEFVKALRYAAEEVPSRPGLLQWLFGPSQRRRRPPFDDRGREFPDSPDEDEDEDDSERTRIADRTPKVDEPGPGPEQPAPSDSAPAWPPAGAAPAVEKPRSELKEESEKAGGKSQRKDVTEPVSVVETLPHDSKLPAAPSGAEHWDASPQFPKDGTMVAPERGRTTPAEPPAPDEPVEHGPPPDEAAEHAPQAIEPVGPTHAAGPAKPSPQPAELAEPGPQPLEPPPPQPRRRRRRVLVGTGLLAVVLAGAVLIWVCGILGSEPCGYAVARASKLLDENNWREAADTVRNCADGTNCRGECKELWPRIEAAWDADVSEHLAGRDFGVALQSVEDAPVEILSSEERQDCGNGVRNAWREHIDGELPRLVSDNEYEKARQIVDSALPQVLSPAEKRVWHVKIEHAGLLEKNNWREAAALLRSAGSALIADEELQELWEGIAQAWSADVGSRLDEKEIDVARRTVDDLPPELAKEPNWQEEQKRWWDRIANEGRYRIDRELSVLVRDAKYDAARRIVDEAPLATVSSQEKDRWHVRIDLAELLGKSNWRDAAGFLRSESVTSISDAEREQLWRQVRELCLADVREPTDGRKFALALEVLEDAPPEVVDHGEWQESICRGWQRLIAQEWSLGRYGNVKKQSLEYLAAFPVDKVPASAQVELLLADCHMYEKHPRSEGEIQKIVRTLRDSEAGEQGFLDRARVRLKTRLIELRFDVFRQEPSSVEAWIDLFRRYETAKERYIADEADGDIADARGDPRWLQSERERVIDLVFERAWTHLAAKEIDPAEKLLQSAAELIDAAPSVAATRKRERAALEAAVMVFKSRSASQESHKALKVLSEYLAGNGALSPTRIMVAAEACVRGYLRLPKDTKADAASATMALQASLRLLDRFNDTDGLPEQKAVAFYGEVLRRFQLELNPFLEKVKAEQAPGIDYELLERFHDGLAGFIELHRFAAFAQPPGAAQQASDYEKENAGLREHALSWAILLHKQRPVAERNGQKDTLAGYHVRRGHARVVQADPDRLKKALDEDAEEALDLHPDLATAHALKSHALLMRSRGRIDLDEKLGDLDGAIEAGVKAQGAGGKFDDASRGVLLLNLSYAHLEKANFFRDPTLEQLKSDLEKARDFALEAAEIEQRYPAYPLLAVGHAYEDLAWLVEHQPEDNYKAAIGAFQKAERQVIVGGGPTVAFGRSLYKAICHTRLDPEQLGAYRTADDVFREIRKLLEQRGNREPDPSASLYLGNVAQVQKAFTLAEEHFAAAWQLALEQAVPARATFAVQWAAFPLSNMELGSEKRLTLALARAELLKKFAGLTGDVSEAELDELATLAKSAQWNADKEKLRELVKSGRLPAAPGGKPDPIKEASLIRARVAWNRGDGAAALRELDAALPQSEERPKWPDLGLLLLRAQIRAMRALREETRRWDDVLQALDDVNRAVDVAVTRFDLATTSREAYLCYMDVIVEMERHDKAGQLPNAYSKQVSHLRERARQHLEQYVKVATASHLGPSLSQGEIKVVAALRQRPPHWGLASEALEEVNGAVEDANRMGAYRRAFASNTDVYSAMDRDASEELLRHTVVANAEKHLNQWYALQIKADKNLKDEELADACDSMSGMRINEAFKVAEARLPSSRSLRERVDQLEKELSLWKSARDWRKKSADLTGNATKRTQRTEGYKLLEKRIRAVEGEHAILKKQQTPAPKT